MAIKYIHNVVQSSTLSISIKFCITPHRHSESIKQSSFPSAPGNPCRGFHLPRKRVSGNSGQGPTWNFLCKTHFWILWPFESHSPKGMESSNPHQDVWAIWLRTQQHPCPSFVPITSSDQSNKATSITARIKKYTGQNQGAHNWVWNLRDSKRKIYFFKGSVQFLKTTYP